MQIEETPKTQDASENIIVVTDPSTDRYHTFGYISWWKQDVVRNAKVMVVGAGALGNEVLKNLALMGIGYILVIDFDTIEDANLSRSVLFRSKDNGRRKAEVAAERVKELNPDVKVMFLHADVCNELGLGVFRRMDAIIGCLDNRSARLLINRYCWHLDKPWVDGAIQELLGEARVFWPGRGACYECTLQEIDYEIINLRHSCPLLARQDIMMGKTPTTPTISSIIAAVQTQDMLKLIHKMPVEAGKVLVFNGLLNDAYLTEYPVKEGCQSHWIWRDIVELPQCRTDSTTLGQLLAIVRQDLGDEAVIEFSAGLGMDFALALRCAACDTSEPVYKPLYRLTLDDGKCPTCGAYREPVLTHTITGQEDFLDKPLQEIGIPPLHILAARSGSKERYYEITGDAAWFMRFV